MTEPFAQAPPGEASFGDLCRGFRMKIKERIAHPLTFAYWPDCLAVDRMTRDQLLALQTERLAALLLHAVQHVPFYRDWARVNGFSAGALPPLKQWPIATKALVRANIDAFQSDAVPLSEMVLAKTSGSSGEPFQLRVHRSSTDYSYACLWRSLRRHGLRPGDRRAYVWGRSYEFNAGSATILKARARQEFRNWLNNTLAVNAYDLSHEKVDEAIARIARFRPVYLHGYVSALYAIARRMIETGEAFAGLALKAVVSESEKVYDFQRETMRAAFGCPVLEHYGSVEFGNIAQPDLAGRLRVADDMFRLETLPTGELVVTNLMSKAFPLIRYKIGDLAAIEGQPDADALPYGVLAEIKGRTVDMVPIQGGGYVHGVALAHVIDPHLRHVLKYQIHQLAIDRFEVLLVGNAALPEDVAERIKFDLGRLVGDNVAIEVRQVSHIEPSLSGKFRWVLSDVSDVAQKALAESGVAEKRARH